MDKGSIFYTIGHSTRSVTELVRLLRGVGADFIVDVRSIPRSRTNPQFNADTLPDTLAGERIGYRHVARLGGLRRRHKGQAVSGNGFWENASFRNYADYAATPDFGAGMAELYDIGRDHVCACVCACVRVRAIMCAEAVWWRCHRRIITDYLLADGHPVFHIMGPGKIERANLTPAAARQADGTLQYAGSGA